MYINMEHSIIVVFTVCCLVVCSVEGSNPDTITFLPGLTKQPSFDQYSGYLAANDGRMFHYWLVTSQSAPKADPLIVWTNGGPGCSSMLGILTENGPFIIQDDGVSLLYNDNSWNKFANVLYIESPAGVGFSYSPDGNVTSSDDLITSDHYTALVDFYKKYPALKSNKLFIIGESYSGVYTPLLAAKVVANIDAGNLTGIVFGGFAIGNGVTNYTFSSNSLIYLLYYHGIIGHSLWDDLVQNCCNGLNDCNFYDTSMEDCADNVAEAMTILETSGLNPYNILANCAGFTPHKPFLTTTPEREIMYRGTLVGEKLSKRLKQVSYRRLSDSPPCLNYTSIAKYLNDPYVKTALHIKPLLPDWTACNPKVEKAYKTIYTNMNQTYISILENLSHKVRILVYNGDLDTACNFLGNQWFVDSIGAEDLVQWRPWLYFDGSDQIAGFIKEYSKIAFATVKGAGHMAPQDKPVATSLLIQNYVTGKPY